MATGLGARKTNADQKYFVAPQAGPDNYVTGGVAAGPVAVKMPGFGGKGNGYNLDPVSMWVWGITLSAIALVLGVHFSFGGRRLL